MGPERVDLGARLAAEELGVIERAVMDDLLDQRQRRIDEDADHLDTDGKLAANRPGHRQRDITGATGIEHAGHHVHPRRNGQTRVLGIGDPRDLDPGRPRAFRDIPP